MVRWSHLEAGECVMCGEPNPDHGRHLRCGPCRGKLLAIMRAKRAARKAAGLCIDCGEPALKGITRCKRHKLANSRGQREWRVRAG
jgi:hypothetical protein